MDFAWISTHPWAYPTLEVVHLVGIGLLVGNLVLLELRVWGAGASLPVPALARLALGLAVGGFAVALGSGGLMLASQWDELSGNRALWLKLGLVLLAGANAVVFHLRHGLERLDGWAKAQTALSLGLWLLVLVCGRFIAYV